MNYFDLQKSINNEITYTQEELYGVFYQSQRLVRECVHMLVDNSTYIQDRCIDIGCEFFSKSDRNRSLFRRSVHPDGEKVADTKPDPIKDKENFCNMCMDLSSSVSNGDIRLQHDIISKMFLSRMVWADFVTEWLKLAAKSVDDYKKLELYHYTDSYDVNEYIGLSNKYHSGLSSLKLRSNIPLVGLYNYLNIRMRALSRIYDKIFRAYSRSVLKMSKDQSSTSDQVIECFQNGSFGLMRAISSYDPNPNSLFAGQSKWWIRQSMLYRMKEESTTIKLSANIWQHFSKLEGFKNRFSSKYKEFTTSDLADVSGYTPEHIESVYQSVQTAQVKSLDCPLTDNNQMTLQSIIPESQDDIADPLDFVELNPNYKRILYLHYGLVSRLVDEHSFDPVAVKMEANRQALSDSIVD